MLSQAREPCLEPAYGRAVSVVRKGRSCTLQKLTFHIIENSLSRFRLLEALNRTPNSTIAINDVVGFLWAVGWLVSHDLISMQRARTYRLPHSVRKSEFACGEVSTPVRLLLPDEFL